MTRARIILLADAQIGVHETARRLAVGRTTVQGWQRRWRNAEQGTIRDWLADAPRCGAPPTYTPEQICAIVAIACERPEDSARPITHWTQQEIAAEAMKRGIVDYVSQRSVGRFLKMLVLACCSYSVDRILADLPILRSLPGFGTLPAAQCGEVYVVDGSAYFSRPGPRIVDSLEILAETLHPELFRGRFPDRGVARAE